MKKIENLNVSNVMDHVNQFDIHYYKEGMNGDNWNSFYSYNSLCCKIDWNNKELTFYPDWNYSKTTRKHLYSFLSTYCFSLNDINNCKDAIKTGKTYRNYEEWKVIEG